VIYRVGIALCIVFTVYGQFASKLATRQVGPFPADWPSRIAFFGRIFLNPLFISCFVAAMLAALCWIMALTHIELSKAYPFMSLNFVLVLLLSSAVLREPLTPGKVAGVALIVAGVVVGSLFG
jgi:drug/metabolite transporter (DMT)-like permease